ncbi:MAG: ribosome-recycling factor, partial [Deltaproteobacteria bacterium]|nr:ribosome-recycling factor [Deltaproteobacteria bacterium]
REEKNIQALTDDFVKQIDQAMADKEEEILQV